MAPTMNLHHLEEGPSLFSSPSYEDTRRSAAVTPEERPKVVDPDHPALHGSLTPPMGTTKLYNFSPGPTNLPPAVEAAIQERCFPSPTEGRLGSMALSHRSPEFGVILQNAVRTTREVMQVPTEYDILFMQGGGHGQFASVPMNLCPTGQETATYIVNGTWSKRAVQEGKKYCRPHVISALEEDGSCTTYPSVERIEAEIDPNSSFLYVCSNETVNGLELHRLPRLSSKVPLVVDASSDCSSKPIDWRACNVGIYFACASKNIGHPGLTLVVVRKDLLGLANPFTPGVFNYETNILADNVWNTIPTFNVDVVGIMMEWILANGGIDSMEAISIAKADLVYDTIDRSDGFFGTPVAKESGYRSRMNVPFCIAGGDDHLTDLFLVECWERGIIGLRTVTPFAKSIYLRASLYHGVSYDDTVVLANFMKEFAARHSISKADEPEMSTTMLATLVESPPDSPLAQQVMNLGACCADLDALRTANNKELFAPLSSSPDSVSDPTMSVLTLPKNFKANQYARLSDGMFSPPSTLAQAQTVHR